MSRAILITVGKILSEMDIPKAKMEINEENLLWLGRNLVIRNRSHPDFPTAKHLIIHLLREINPNRHILFIS